MYRLGALLALCLALLLPSAVQASTIEVTMNSINAEGIGESIGTISARDTDQGLVIIPELSGLSEGEHGFHLHAGAQCDPQTNAEGASIAGLASLGHWDPDQTDTHLGPFGNGHRGDLSRLVVDRDGNTTTSVVAPRLKASDLRGRALVVHAGGDTYTDTPPLGGGGARIACGVGS
ncbi:superoxide dismutase [Cu-Zn] SodC [Synechococcus sp. AH-551-E11]|nr:superoxide dismutase [Cu-Zn] SodC [Synechococcus sp. AH-551-E11]MDB4616707.1 superoxide dismutase [Cu-Zn] SodC [Synechococcus sp. AH-551-E11]